ncbi:MAG: hypothetical protein EOP06_06030, partial [Proteobacteria bacterium]
MTRIKTTIGFIRTISFASLLLLGVSAGAAGSGVTYQGRILKPDGSALNGANVQFRFQIRSPDAGDCLLYEELKPGIDMRNANGVFSVTMNDGSGIRSNLQISDNGGPLLPLNIDRVFSNSGSLSFDPSTCASGNSYVPNASDGRNLAVFFKDETMSGWEPIPAQKINFVPFAFESKQISGFNANSLVRVADAGVLGNISPLSNSEYTKLLALIAGNSSEYEKSGRINGAAAPTMASGQVLGWNGTTWTSLDPLAGVQAFAKTSLPVCGAGQFLKDNGSGLLTCGTPSGTATGTVTSVAAGAGLTTGGPAITTSGTLSLATLGSAGSGAKVSFDVYGRVTGTSALVESDIPNLSAGGKVSGTAITSGTIGGSTSINTSGAITTSASLSAGAISGASISAPTGSITTLSTQSLQILRTANDFKVSVVAPSSLSSDYTLTLPTTVGVSGKVLGTTGSGVLDWVDASAGGITQLTGDVTTASGSGAQAATIAPAAVTFSKIQNISTNRLLGRSTASSGSVEQITLGSGLTLTGGVLTSSDTMAAVSVCGNGYVPYKSGGVWTCVEGTAAGTIDTIVKRDSSGSFVAGGATLTAALKLKDGTTGGEVTLSSPTSFSSYALRLPATAGASGQVLGNLGSGNLGWQSIVESQWTTNGTSINYAPLGNVGIGVAAPTEKLDVAGGIKLGSSVASGAGTLRWNGTNFQGSDGTSWFNIMPNPPAAAGCDQTQTFTTPGNHAYTVPAGYATITVRVWGAGGSGASAEYFHGANGGASSVASLSLSASGGNGGQYDNGTGGAAGTGGVAAGGSTNQNGTSGTASTPSAAGDGGSAPFGGTGGNGAAPTYA